MKRLICWLKGHEFNSYGGEDCTRCGRYISFDEFIQTSGGFVFRIRQRKYELIKFFKPCDECGKRFGRHDETKEHLPF